MVCEKCGRLGGLELGGCRLPSCSVTGNLRGPISSQGCINSCRLSDLASDHRHPTENGHFQAAGATKSFRLACKVTGALKLFVSQMSRLEVRTEAPAAKLHYSLMDSFIHSRFVHLHLLSAAFP
jgi:hypothetical protein